MIQARPDNASAYARIVAKAWSDAAFKARLLADPTGAITEAGFAVPAGMVVSAVESSDSQVYLVLPARPAELSDAQLEAIAGGFAPGDMPGIPPELSGKF